MKKHIAIERKNIDGYKTLCGLDADGKGYSMLEGASVYADNLCKKCKKHLMCNIS